MRTIDSREYALRVEDEIEGTIEVDMFDLFNELAEHFGFPKQNDFGEFSAVYYDCHAATIRDEVIKLFEECGMDVTSDGRDF